MFPPVVLFHQVMKSGVWNVQRICKLRQCLSVARREFGDFLHDVIAVVFAWLAAFLSSRKVAFEVKLRIGDSPRLPPPNPSPNALRCQAKFSRSTRNMMSFEVLEGCQCC